MNVLSLLSVVSADIIPSGTYEFTGPSEFYFDKSGEHALVNTIKVVAHQSKLDVTIDEIRRHFASFSLKGSIAPGFEVQCTNILYELVDNRLEPLPDTVPKGTVTNIVPIRYFGRNFEKVVETLGKIPVADQKRMKKLWDLDDDCLNKVLHTDTPSNGEIWLYEGQYVKGQSYVNMTFSVVKAETLAYVVDSDWLIAERVSSETDASEPSQSGDKPDHATQNATQNANHDSSITSRSWFYPLVGITVVFILLVLVLAIICFIKSKSKEQSPVEELSIMPDTIPSTTRSEGNVTRKRSLMERSERMMMLSPSALPQ